MTVDNRKKGECEMHYRNLGSSGIKVSEVCLGTWTIGAEGWTGVKDDESIETVNTALDVGMNFIDTAHAYGLGHAETVIGEALKGRRDEAVICTKAGTRWDEQGVRYPDCSYDFIMQAVEDALKRLQTDYIDAYLVHYYRPEVPHEETIGAMKKLLDQKVIRVVGVSRYDVSQLEEAGKIVSLDAGQYPLSLFEQDTFYMNPGVDASPPNRAGAGLLRKNQHRRDGIWCRLQRPARRAIHGK
jgi:aryl-alcohol dehydrogenase-like predicted oxidoreductase